MCLAIRPVTFGKTVVGLYEANADEHVIYYQNVVGASGFRPRPPIRALGAATTRRTSLTAPRTRRGSSTPDNWDIGDGGNGQPQGNALVIPILTDDFDSIELLRGTAQMPRLLSDIRTAVQPPTNLRGGLRRGPVFAADSAKSVRIEQFDIYTLVLAKDASLIPEAVEQVDADKRPPLAQEIFDSLQRLYKCPFVVACFNDRDAGESKPIAYKYAPRYKDKFMVYTLDGHDGKAPNLDAEVELDHAIFAGSYRQTTGRRVNYSDNIPASLQGYVPEFVVGTAFPKGTKLVNGDILMRVKDVVNGKLDAYRVLPPHSRKKRQPISLADAINA